MSDDSNVSTPEPGESAGLDTAPPDTRSRPASRLYRLVPSWGRRRPALTGFGAGIVAAALIAGGVYEAQLPAGPPRGAYTVPPKQPCAMISAAELDFAGELGCHCKGVTATTRPVSGLGDQATEAFVAAGPEADSGRSPSASLPGTSLLVRSSNAVVMLTLGTTATVTGTSLATPPSDAQRAAMIAMARGVLAGLARPGSAPATAWLPDVGEQAAAIFRTQSGQDGVYLLVWSGNAELRYWYTTTSGPSRPRAELLAGAIAMSRDGLAALSSPAASSFRPSRGTPARAMPAPWSSRRPWPGTCRAPRWTSCRPPAAFPPRRRPVAATGPPPVPTSC